MKPKIYKMSRSYLGERYLRQALEDRYLYVPRLPEYIVWAVVIFLLLSLFYLGFYQVNYIIDLKYKCIQDCIDFNAKMIKEGLTLRCVC